MATRSCFRLSSSAGTAIVWFAAAVAIVVLLARPTVADELRHSSADDRVKAFEWFATLGYPDVAKLPLVEVATGAWYQGGSEGPPHADRPLPGFLLSEEGDRFSILTLGLVTREFTKTGPLKKSGEPVHDYEAVAFKPIDLVRFATDTVEKDETRLLTDQMRAEETLCELFVLAWACQRQGHEAAAIRVFDTALSTPDRKSKQSSPRGLDARVADAIAHLEMWRTVVAFGDPAISRQKLLERFNWIIKNFPHSEHFERAKATAALLSMMIDEDRNHPATPTEGPDWDKLSRKDQIAELIFELRDQNSRQYMQPGSCHIFDFYGARDEATPAHRLAKIGFDAVPQLIDALTDPRPTRSVGYLRDFWFSHHALTVGDCAEQILDEIAGRRFHKITGTGGYMAQDGSTDQVVQDVRQWYAEIEKKGEKQTLIDAMGVDNDQSLPQAMRLLKKYPDDGLPAVMAAVRGTKDGWRRNLMVELVGAITSEPVTEFLLDELRHGPIASARLAAARALHHRGRREGVDVMLEHWRSKKLPAPLLAPHLEPTAESSDTQGVAIFLIDSGRLDAFAAVAERFADLSSELRMSIIQEIAGRGSIGRAAKPADGEGAEKNADDGNDAAALDAARLKLLVGALDDTSQRPGVSYQVGKNSIHLRVCDFAGAALNRLDPDRFAFDLAASEAARDRSRVVLKNVWLKEQGQPELPLPAELAP